MAGLFSWLPTKAVAGLRFLFLYGKATILLACKAFQIGIGVMSSVTSVLTTVNAPHSVQLDGATLADCLRNISLARTHPGHVSSFFGEISPEEQVAFAAHFGVSRDVLVATAKAFASYSGERYPLVA